MFDFFKSARTRPEPRPSESPPQSDGGPSSTPSHTATRRELVRVVLRDTLRMHGIPIEWISCEISAGHSPTKNQAWQIHLTVRKWHEGLPRYAPLLQQLLLQGLQRFDPSHSHDQHLVFWRFAEDCGYPYTSMPAPAWWSTQPALSARPKFDLPPSDRDFGNDDFAPTVPNDLR